MILFELLGEMFDRLLTWFFVGLFIIIPIAFIGTYALDIIKTFPTFFSVIGAYLVYKGFVFFKNL